MGKQALTLVVVCSLRLAARADGGDTEQAARELYQQGVTHYDLAEYEQAIVKFKAAYELSRAPRLLFNIAQAYRLEGPGSCRNAQQFYRSYLRVDPAAENRAAVEQWLHELEPCVEQETPPKSPPPPPAPTVSPAPQQPAVPSTRAWPRWVLAGGGAGLVAGSGLLLWVWHDYDAAKAGCRPDCSATRDRLTLRADIGYGLLGIGGVLAASGIVLWIRGGDRDDRSAYVAPAPGGVVVGGRF